MFDLENDTEIFGHAEEEDDGFYYIKDVQEYLNLILSRKKPRDATEMMDIGMH